MTAYYNENKPEAAAALRQLIQEGVIAPGIVDDRSIKEVQAHELRQFTQWHFFAGGGLWSVAARIAGWPDERPILTASCPCQPFSVAGQGAGTDDPRHLWPDLYRIICAARDAGFCPPVLVGEQVAGKAGYGWFDGIRADLARKEISSRMVDIPACAVDAPHERNRLYWLAVASAYSRGRDGRPQDAQRSAQRRDATERADVELVDAPSIGRGERWPEHEFQCRRDSVASTNGEGDLADAYQPIVQGQSPVGQLRVNESDGGVSNRHADGPHGSVVDADSTRLAIGQSERSDPRPECAPAQRANGRNSSWWADAEWIECHDGKARRAKSDICLLVNGMAGRSHLWSLAGNSIVPVLAAEVIASFLDAEAATASPVLKPLPPVPY